MLRLVSRRGCGVPSRLWLVLTNEILQNQPIGVLLALQFQVDALPVVLALDASRARELVESQIDGVAGVRAPDFHVAAKFLDAEILAAAEVSPAQPEVSSSGPGGCRGA